MIQESNSIQIDTNVITENDSITKDKTQEEEVDDRTTQQGVDEEFEYDETVFKQTTTVETNQDRTDKNVTPEKVVLTEHTENSVISAEISTKVHGKEKTDNSVNEGVEKVAIEYNDNKEFVENKISPTSVESKNVLDKIGTLDNHSDEASRLSEKHSVYGVKTEHDIYEGINEDFKKAQSEWNNVEEISAEEIASPSQVPNAVEFISYDETLDHFQQINLHEYSDKIRPCIKYSGFSALWHNLTGPPKLNKGLLQERDLIFTIAVVMFENSIKTHVDILKTIYKQLTKTRIDCQRYGGHWETIGFQGNDPTTDLRGCGMLGLLTTLYFVSSKNTASLARSVYLLSQDEIQNFPFCVMSINITRISLQILREGKLNKECNVQYKHKGKYAFGGVFDVFLKLYSAIFHKIYHIWKTQNKTMAESGFVLRDVEDNANNKPMELIKDFERMQSLKNTVKTNKSQVGEKVESFVGIEDL